MRPRNRRDLRGVQDSRAELLEVYPRSLPLQQPSRGTGRRRSLSTLLLVLGLSVPAAATTLRLYSGFGEVRQQVTSETVDNRTVYRMTFPHEVWKLIEPGSLSLTGAPLLQLQVRPTDLDWLITQEGRSVRVLRVGQPQLQATLVRASDLLVRLSSGEYLNVTRNELAFPTPPPKNWLQGGVAARFEVAAQGRIIAEVSYRTRALSWEPRYELRAARAYARLKGLADIRNVGSEAYDAKQVELFAGKVPALPFIGFSGERQLGRIDGVVPSRTTTTPLFSSLPNPLEVGVWQRYALPTGLKLGQDETLTVPLMETDIKDFTRYNRIGNDFDRQEHSGWSSRQYQFTPEEPLPAGPLTVWDEGTLLGTVALPGAQAGQSVNLDLGADNTLKYIRTAEQLGEERNSAGKRVSMTYRVIYTLTSSKTYATTVQIDERVVGRPLAVDDRIIRSQEVSIKRQVEVPAGQKVTLAFKVKLGTP